MRKISALYVLLLAGCASAQTPGPQPTFTIRRIPPSGAAADNAERVSQKPPTFRIVDARCQTGDRMATDVGTSSRTYIPNAVPLSPLPYIPNACGVTKPPTLSSGPSILHRNPKPVPQPQP